MVHCHCVGQRNDFTKYADTATQLTWSLPISSLEGNTSYRKECFLSGMAQILTWEHKMQGSQISRLALWGFEGVIQMSYHCFRCTNSSLYCVQCRLIFWRIQTQIRHCGRSKTILFSSWRAHNILKDTSADFQYLAYQALLEDLKMHVWISGWRNVLSQGVISIFADI